MLSLSWVNSAALRTTSPMILTASMLIPARVDPILTDEQTWSVSAIACGIDSIKARSPAENPL